MIEKRELSEAAKWFLEDFQKNLNDFANQIGLQVLIVDREGSLVNQTRGVQKICQNILSSQEGKTRCNDHFKESIHLVKNQNETIFSQCYAGFASLRVPIVVRESIIGAIIVCGGRYDKETNKEKIKEKFSNLADEIGVINKDNFITLAFDDVKSLTKKDAEEIVENIKKLFEIFSSTAFTPLKEIFG